MIAMFMNVVFLLLQNIPITVDRTILSVSITIALFLLTHILLAVRWGSRMSATIEQAVRRMDEMAKDMHEIKGAIVKQAVLEERLEGIDKRTDDVVYRVSQLERRRVNGVA